MNLSGLFSFSGLYFCVIIINVSLFASGMYPSAPVFMPEPPPYPGPPQNWTASPTGQCASLLLSNDITLFSMSLVGHAVYSYVVL